MIIRSTWQWADGHTAVRGEDVDCLLRALDPPHRVPELGPRRLPGGGWEPGNGWAEIMDGFSKTCDLGWRHKHTSKKARKKSKEFLNMVKVMVRIRIEAGIEIEIGIEVHRE